MMKTTLLNRLLMTAFALLAMSCGSDDAGEVNAQTTANGGKTLVVYYSFTNNVRTIVNDLQTQISADVVEVQPAEEGLDYAANNYAIGSSLIAAIRANPDDAGSYPAIKSLDVDVSQYDNIIVATPLWWSQMAAPMQTFLFHNSPKMAGKNIGLIVSSQSSGISSVVADAKRLIPGGTFLEPNLWIRSSQVSNAHALLSEWIGQLGLNASTAIRSVRTEGKPSRAYTLSGTLARAGLKGIVIQDGKKIIR